MAPAFDGFPEDGLRFLKALKRNNRRDWFQPRKEVYETQVKAPMTTLVEALNADLAKVAPDYVTDPKKAIFRIYRDTRFSHDKTPYKTHIAAVFGRRGAAGHTGGMLYFHVAPDHVEIAGGIYHPGPPTLLRVREHLAAHHAGLRKLLANARLRKIMGELKGDALTRVPKGFAADHPAADLIRMKDWILDIELEPEMALSRTLYDELRTRFRLMLPFVEFLNSGLSAAPPAVRASELLW